MGPLFGTSPGGVAVVDVLWVALLRHARQWFALVFKTGVLPIEINAVPIEGFDELDDGVHKTLAVLVGGGR